MFFRRQYAESYEADVTDLTINLNDIMSHRVKEITRKAWIGLELLGQSVMEIELPPLEYLNSTLVKKINIVLVSTPPGKTLRVVWPYYRPIDMALGKPIAFASSEVLCKTIRGQYTLKGLRRQYHDGGI